MSYRLLKAHYEAMVNLAAVNGLATELHLIRFSPQSSALAFIRTEPHITFADGATLRFHEEIEVANDSHVQYMEYSYHYEREGYFFRYDKDPERARPYCHHETHLHANQENVRFITHETNFEEVFKFIVTCFYS